MNITAPLQKLFRKRQAEKKATPKTVLYSGPGLNQFLDEEGKLEIRYAGGIKQFDRVAPAVIFYGNLVSDASLWDISGTPVLIEAKTYLSH